MNKTAWALLILGLLQMFGATLSAVGLTGIGRPIQGIAAATTASPAPKVFTSVRGLETFSTKFTFEWDGRDGLKHALELTPELYQKVRGPYNRRNVYGAVLAYGPVLLTNEITRPMFESVQRFALTDAAPLLRELGIDPIQIDGTMRVRYDPRPNSPVVDWPRVIEVERR